MDALTANQFYYLPTEHRLDTASNDLSLSRSALLQQIAMYPVGNVSLPPTPIYSRPSSSSSQCGTMSKPVFFGNPRSVMTPSSSPNSSNAKAAALLGLNTSFDTNACLPSTPPLSGYGGSFTGAGDMLQTPINPMFSGLDESFDKWSLDWPACVSPPMTPIYVTSQPVSLSRSSTDLSATSCPSLSQSPSSTPYTRAVSLDSTSSFCDPRNLTVASSATPILASDIPSYASLAQQPVGAVYANTAVPQNLHIDCEQDFASQIVELGEGSFGSGIRRPRAITASSVVSLGQSSFVEEETPLESTDNLVLAYLQAPPSQCPCPEEQIQPASKRVKRADSSCHVSTMPTMLSRSVSSASSTSDAGAPCKTEDQNGSPDDNTSVVSDGSSGNKQDGSGSAKRRGRKQSVTEDPTKTWVCDICHRRFRRQEHLKRHTRSLHTMEKPFKCNDCGKTFSRSDNLAQHARTHGTGAIVMDILDDGTVTSYDPSRMVVDGFRELGSAFYQMASHAMSDNISDAASDGDSSDSNQKKRKRASQ